MAEWRARQLFSVRGQLDAARGDNEAARQNFNAAIEIFDDLGSRIELGGMSGVVRAACHGEAGSRPHIG